MFWHSLRKKGFIPRGGDLIALEFSPKLFPTNRFFMRNLFIALVSSTILCHAQESNPSNEKKTQPEIPQFVQDLRNLPDEQKKQYQELFNRCDQLFKQRRIFECLETLYKLDQIYDGNPASQNLAGACYVEFRNFDKARLAFEKTLSSQPTNFNVRFNLAEIEFVSHNWAEALELFEVLDQDSSGKSRHANMNPLIKFKMILCMLKTDKVDEAQKIIDNTTFLDDSPLHYFGTAAMCFHQEKGGEAESWLARCRQIFRNQGLIAPWQDTLVEFGYIKSFYGGDLEVDQTNPAGEGE